jgi:hypothetical protein
MAGERLLCSSYGFQVRSQVPLRFLRAGRADSVLEVAQGDGRPPSAGLRPLVEWSLRGAPDISAKLYLEGAAYRYWISDAGWYWIDPAARTVDIPLNGDEIVREHRLWGVPALLCAASRGDFFLHAAAAEVGKGAVLFAGPGRHGKTTLALAFHRAGYRVVSEDSACLRLGPPSVLLPGPALLRVRPDVFDGRAPAGMHVVSVRDDRIYLALDEGSRGSDDPLPVRALLFLRESTGEVHLERVRPARALPDLWALSFRLPEEGARARSFKQLSGFAASVPIWNLYRPLRLESLDRTVGKIVATLASL